MSARVLVVDDIEQNRKLLSDKLKNEYFHVSTAVDGEDGVEKALAEEPDVMLRDLMIPELNGIHPCWKPTKESLNKKTPILHVIGD